MPKQYGNINGETLIKDWVRNGINKDAVLFAEQFGRDLATMKKKTKDGKERDESMTTAQIRNVFGEVRRIQMANKKAAQNPEAFDESAILLLKPKLAYSAKRADRDAIYELRDILSKGIDAVVADGTVPEKIRRFENFANFFEAVLAYHKASEDLKDKNAQDEE